MLLDYIIFIQVRYNFTSDYGSHQISKRLEELKQEYEKKNGKIRRSRELSENPILPSVQGN